MIRKLFGLVAATLLLSSLATGVAGAHPERHGPRPVIFVHGGAGSAHQYQTQAKRFASNGYPAGIVEGHDYDSTFATNTMADVHNALDARVIRLLQQTGADRVDMLGHSLGTAVMQGYLNSSPARAARVAHYVNLDGATAAALPGGVPTLAIWGEGNPARAIVGATNLYLSDQSHTQTVTSPESFAAVYGFFTGRAPRTTQVLPQRRGPVLLSGRAVIFPTNVGVTGGRLEIYRLHSRSGSRLHRRPDAVYGLTGDGSWGPFRADGRARYEFAIVRAGAATHHLYYQPFVRTDRIIRLLTSPPGGGLGSQIEASDGTSALVLNRNKEWWGDQGAGSDQLWINGQQVLNAANTPRTKRVIGIFAYDEHLDGVTDLTAPIPFFFSQIFISGIDVHMPARPNRPGTVTVASRQRGGSGRLEVLTVPAWPSTTDRSTLNFNDYPAGRRGW